MPSVREAYRLWSTHPYFDPQTRAALQTIAGDEREIAERFDRCLDFGTGGMRGLLGAGTNRINAYTVRQAAQGLAAHLLHAAPDAAFSGGVVIAHDSRHGSAEFALQTALTLCANAIPAYLWESPQPTPLLSFAVRDLGTAAGVVITASHNPPEYNGFKVYREDGAQLLPAEAARIRAQMLKTNLLRIRPLQEAEARQRRLLRRVPAAVNRAYLDRLLALLTLPPAQRAAYSILYTPLHGSGSALGYQALAEAGFPVALLAAQAEPNPDFPGLPAPNPEEPEVFRLALEEAARTGPDLILATDADADRLGGMFREQDGRYQFLTGNQIGVLLLDYLLARRERPEAAAVVKTLATTELIHRLCERHGVQVIETHTGFKYIGAQLRDLTEGGSPQFLFGCEESHGYLAAPFVRDKDGIMAALLLAEAAAWHKAAGRTLGEALTRLWQEFGYFRESIATLALPGRSGEERMERMMQMLRLRPPRELGGLTIERTEDYRSGVVVDHATGSLLPAALEPADVLRYRLAGGGFVVIRPSGTEPKLKVYLSVTGQDGAEAEARMQRVRFAVSQLL